MEFECGSVTMNTNARVQSSTKQCKLNIVGLCCTANDQFPMTSVWFTTLLFVSNVSRCIIMIVYDRCMLLYSYVFTMRAKK